MKLFQNFDFRFWMQRPRHRPPLKALEFRENTLTQHGKGQIVGILQPLTRLQDESGVG